GRRQVDEKDLVEAAPPRELRREMIHFVRRRGDEHRRRPLLKPRQERSEHAYLTRITGCPGAEALLDFVDPQYDRSDRGHRPKPFTKRVLWRRRREDGGEIQSHEREPEHRGRGLARMRLSATLDAAEEHSPRLRQPERPSIVTVRAHARGEPGFED